MKTKKMKSYENFMNIKLSKKDKEVVFTYFGDNYSVFKIKQKDVKSNIYSKIVIHFINEDDFCDVVNDAVDIKNYAHCWDWNKDKYEYILYTDSDNCFEDCCEQLKDYNCSIFQFIYE